MGRLLVGLLVERLLIGMSVVRLPVGMSVGRKSADEEATSVVA